MIKLIYVAVVVLLIVYWFVEFIRQLSGKREAAEEAAKTEEVATGEAVEEAAKAEEVATGEAVEEAAKTVEVAQGRPEEKITLRTAAKVFGLALLFRLLLYVCATTIYMIFRDEAKFSLQAFFECWAHWDSPHYLDIAEKGYANCIENGQHLFLVFFPLYPWLVRLFHLICPSWQLAGMLVSTLSFAVGAVFFYATLVREYDRDVAEKALVLLSVSPFAFFFGAAMTESLFFCMVSIAFYLIKRHCWLGVGLIGLLCSLCRAQGVIILGVAGVEFLLTYSPVRLAREKKLGTFFQYVFTKGIFLLLIPVGNLIYCYINYVVEGNAFQFVIYQREHWHLSPTFFTNSLEEIVSYLVNPTVGTSIKVCIWIPEYLAFVLAMAALAYGIKRHPLKYTAYLFVYTMICYSVTWLISGGRYMLCAFPLFMIAGEFTHRHPKIYPWLISLSSFLMAVYATGYFLWKQVM
ncbi:MAG: glycosyltransferase family 39 protein [Lachnospiraceae bacterium]|nr:glycosyltransferase family 39 protein [Lachnospiraceae bacterium]